MKTHLKAFIAIFCLVISFLTVSAQTIPQPTNNDVPLLRYFNHGSHKHIYTTNPNEFGAGSPPNFVYEGVVGWLSKMPNPLPNVNPTIYRYRNTSTGAYFLSKQIPPIPGAAFEGAIGWQPTAPFYIYPIHEYYNNAVKDYVYTANPQLENLAGWTYNGIAFYVK